MALETTCPRCQHVLRVSRDVAGSWLTCPRCLGSIRNPNELTQSERPAARPPEDAGEPAGRDAVCDDCGRAVDSRWRVCPFCEAPLRGPRRLTAPEFDRDVRRETGAGWVVALVLGGMLLIGVCFFLSMGGPALVGASRDSVQVFAFGGGTILAVAVGCIALAATSKSKVASTAAGVIGGIVVGIGVTGLLVLLSCMSFIQACFGGRR
jgi:hypothetical protein